MINDPYIGMPIIIDNDWNEPCPDCGCRPETPDIPQDPGNHGENGGSFDSMYLNEQEHIDQADTGNRFCPL